MNASDITHEIFTSFGCQFCAEIKPIQLLQKLLNSTKEWRSYAKIKIKAAALSETPCRYSTTTKMRQIKSSAVTEIARVAPRHLEMSFVIAAFGQYQIILLGDREAWQLTIKLNRKRWFIVRPTLEDGQLKARKCLPRNCGMVRTSDWQPRVRGLDFWLFHCHRSPKSLSWILRVTSRRKKRVKG